MACSCEPGNDWRVHRGIRVSHKGVAEGLNLNGMWRYVVGRVVPGVSTVHRVFICRIKLSSEVEGTTFLRNVRRYSPNYTAFHPCADLTLEPSDSIKQRVIFLLSGEPLASDEGLFSLKLFSEMFVYLFLLIHSLFLVYLTKLLVTQTIQR